MTTDPIETLPAEYSDGAWGALFGRSQITVELPPPDLEEWLKSGNVLPSSAEVGRLRQLGLGVVVQPGDVELTTGGELTGARVAGFARIVLLTDARPDISVDAWIMAQWRDSTTEAAEELGRLYELADGPAPEPPPREAVLLTDLQIVATDSRLQNDLNTAAFLLGHRLHIFTPDDYLRRALPHVQAEAPRVLLVADTVPARCEPIVLAYRSAASRPRVGTVPAVSGGELLSRVRGHLATAAGISPGLMLLHRAQAVGPVDLDEGPAATQSPRMPIVKEGRRLYHQRFRLFIECEETGYFYTIDNARHGSVVKRYRETATQLVWDADLDADGRVLPKHKSQVGMTIPKTELSGA